MFWTTQETNETIAPIVKNNTSNSEQPIEEKEQTTPTSVVHSQNKKFCCRRREQWPTEMIKPGQCPFVFCLTAIPKEHLSKMN